jgi:hypothetical protein
MKASDLLDRRAVDESGQFLGHVVGLRATQDGPPVGTTALLRIHEVLLSRRHIGSWLGYQNPDQKGPWLLAAAVRRLHRRDVVVAWDDVLDWSGDGDLRVRGARAKAADGDGA